MPLTPIRVVWIASLVLTASVMFASPAFAQSKCSLKSLDGSYGVKFDGQSENLGRFASVSLWAFDGKGGLEASESFSSEATGPNTRTITGSYQVEPTCAFRLLFPSTLGAPHDVVGDCVLVDSGKSFTALTSNTDGRRRGSENASTRPVDQKHSRSEAVLVS